MKYLLFLMLIPFFANAERYQESDFGGDAIVNSTNTSTSNVSGNATYIDTSDNSEGDIYLESLQPSNETIINVTCPGLSMQLQGVSKDNGEDAIVAGLIYSFPTESCKKAAGYQAEAIRMQYLRETMKTKMMCRKLRRSVKNDDEALVALSAFCK